MKRFLGFVVKEFYHIFRDYRTLLILFGMPAVQLLLFGYVITNEIKDARIAILDQSKDEVTRKISEKVLSSGYFLLDKNLNSSKEIEQVFRNGNVKLVLIFGADFSKNLDKTGKAKVQIIGDASDPNTANMLVNYIQGILSNYLISLNAEKAPMQITPEVRMMYNGQMKGVYMFVPGLMAMLLMLISALMTSLSITREKELGTMELLLVSPLKPIQIIIGKVFPYVFLAFLDACIIIILGNTVFGVPVVGSVALLLLESLLFICMALSLGILISTTTSSQQIAMMLSLVALMLPTILLSGFIFPVENMPLILQWLCYFMPPKYFITIIKSIMLQGNGFRYIVFETGILVGFTLLFILLSVKKFKVRLS
ncbi:MAG: ABC transporter permease [Bacteroidales bacterium]|nr:ABC transporter permease [Bacteroidales bacterium]MDD4602757.1 ABC transporter permease [Bacteroidales bacterium]